MEAIVQTEWLLQHLHDANVRIVDCRFALGSPAAGRESYEQGHIEGAVFFDLDADLSAPIGPHGGRHPLPDMDTLADKLGKAGIGNDTIVVAYDDAGGAYATRLWWLLRYMGHTAVAILDGGYARWVVENRPITARIPQYATVTYTPMLRQNRLATMEMVRERLGKAGVTIVDSREEKRYAGEEEPIDPVAGRIPEAVHHFWQDVIAPTGEWKSPADLTEQFAAIPKEDEIIVYCGSGVTACPNVLALERAGYTNVRLYAGSWSDWITYPDNPIATGR